jgi:uncharacterized membrane protein
VSELTTSVGQDVHPPVYYLLLKMWIGVAGDSVAGLRSLSVAAGVLALVLAWHLARRWLATGPALAALLWMAVSPHLVFHAQEARMYAPATAAALAACLGYRRWVDSRFTATGALAGFVASASVSLYLHYFTALLIATCTLHFAFIAGRAWAPWRRWTLAHLVVLAIYLPWLTTAITQLTRGQPWRQPVAIDAMPDRVLALLGQLFIGSYLPWPIDGVYRLGGATAIALAVAGVATLAVRQQGRRRTETDGFLALAALAPAAGGLTLVLVAGDMYLSRYLAYLTPLAIVAAARGLSLLPGDSRLLTCAVAAGAMASLPALGVYYSSSSRDTDVRLVAAYINAAAGSGGIEPANRVIVAPDYLIYPLSYYSRHAGLLYTGVKPGADLWGTIESTAAATPARPLWIVLDYRWSNFRRDSNDARLVQVDLPAGRAPKIRLLRLQELPGPAEAGPSVRPGQH